MNHTLSISKHRLILVLSLFLFATGSRGQEIAEITIDVMVASDTILMDNIFEVKYSLTHDTEVSLSIPSFKAFEIIGGPNSSSSMSIVKGIQTFSISKTVLLIPLEPGVFEIPSATARIDNQSHRSTTTQVVVIPNPTNKQVDYRLENEFDSSLFFGMPRQEKKKKKRKIYKI